MVSSLKTFSKLRFVLLAVCASSGSCFNLNWKDSGKQAWQKAQRFALTANHLPSGGRVAVLMRGQSFRGENGACDVNARDRQLDGTTSFVKNVLDPLNYELHNWIDVVAVDSSNCKLTPQMIRLVDTNRVHGVGHFDSETQGLAVQRSLQYFEERLGGAEEISKYQMVLIARTDLDWKNKNIIDWPGNFSRFNFPDMCPEEQRADPKYGQHCVSDLFQIMPGRLYPAFRDAVLTNGTGCFDSCVGEHAECHRVGHWCWDSVKKAVNQLQGDVGFAFHEEIPDTDNTQKVVPKRIAEQYLRIIPLSEILDRKSAKEAQCCLLTPSAPCCTNAHPAPIELTL